MKPLTIDIEADLDLSKNSKGKWDGVAWARNGSATTKFDVFDEPNIASARKHLINQIESFFSEVIRHKETVKLTIPL